MYRKWRRIVSIKFLPLIASFVAGYLTSLWILNFPNENQSKKLQRDILFNFENLSYFLICLIFTSVKNLSRRNSIRNTWLNFGKNLQFKYYFVIGTNGLSSESKNEIISENHTNGDLLLLSDLSDTYSNLTLKVIHSFKWIATNHKEKFQFLLKVDDDSFVRIDSLYRYLKQRHQENPSKPIYLGFFDGRAHVKQKGIWKEKNWFLCDQYLPYALGGGYVLSHQLIEFVSANSQLFQLYQSEDVSLGTWLAPLSINRIHDMRFDTEFKSRGCINNFLIQHKQSINDMKLKYNSLINFGRLCSKEFENRLTYEYNWNVLPSKCCIRNKTMIK